MQAKAKAARPTSGAGGYKAVNRQRFFAFSGCLTSTYPGKRPRFPDMEKCKVLPHLGNQLSFFVDMKKGLTYDF
jgi:hypothetical protein